MVRFINYSSNKNLNIKLGDFEFKNKNDYLYYPVAPGMHFIELNEDWIELLVKSNEYYTIIALEGGLQTFHDIKHKNPAKAQIYLYNLLDYNCSLKAGEEYLDVFKKIEKFQSSQVSVNPINESFYLYVEDNEVAQIASLPLKRGGSSSIIIFNLDNKIEYKIINAQVWSGS